MPPLSSAGYLLLGFTAFVGFLAGLLGFAALRVLSGGRDSGRRMRETSADTAILSAALEEAVGKLKQQERSTLARAEASERLNAQIVEGLTSGLLVAGADGKVRMLNPAGHRILGVAPRVMPADLDDLLSPVPALAALVREAAAGRRTVSRRHIATGEVTGGPSHLGVTLSPWSGGPGEGGVICLFTDLSRVVALEEQLRLKDALARLGELTAGLAHEFRNGLATIHGYARLLDPAALPAPHGAYAEGIRGGTLALGDVVTKFLEFARPERVTLQPLALELVVRRAVHDVDADGTLVTVAGAFGHVEGDDVLLRQAFSNLVRNAIEACQRAGRPPAVEVRGTVRAQDGVVEVTVSDNGTGLPETDRDRLFQPFFTTRSDGTGLGLALVLKFIVTHNGRVRAANRSKGGAVFTVLLPLRAATPGFGQ
ncbi:MAG: PAS domain-containing protein [Acidobacteria bacterium]|nr:PAS domain-containing protein [Acidobacteriota bacterium]